MRRARFSTIQPAAVFFYISAHKFRELVPRQHGNKTECKASKKIKRHVKILTVLHQRRPFAHKCGKGGKSAAEARSEQQFCRWRHKSVAIPVEPREKPNDEASQHVHNHRAKRKDNESARLHHLRHTISQPAPKETSNANQQQFLHRLKNL